MSKKQKPEHSPELTDALNRLRAMPADVKRHAHASGVSLIAQERARQVHDEGWTPEHDDKHTGGELAQAAAYYCWPDAPERICRRELFPTGWDERFAKREGDRTPTLRDLVKAGALIAAEIDRRLAAERASKGE